MGMNPSTNSGELGLENFFKQVKEIEKQYDKLDKLLITLQEAHEESKAVTKAASMKAIKRRMEKDVDEVGKVALGIKSMIEAIDRDNLSNRQKPGCGKGTAVDRARTATTISVKRKLKDKMSEFQIMDTLAEIQEHHDAVREVEKKLLDLQQIFLDMAVLVEAQGDLLDNIESRVSTAVDHVQSGNTALQRAKSMQKNSRKWMCIGILILLIIVCIIVVTVLKPWKNKGA